jgi:hypothetical protein
MTKKVSKKVAKKKAAVKSESGPDLSTRDGIKLNMQMNQRRKNAVKAG